ncbi:DUF7033 domain-containing protein [Hymenobacter sp. B81]|uniref:DUF7033 domain-containing protein n=1 Tax=Hymenobacter sp. B81 TaxID=3344878 RepID=UPI0037DD245E
MSLPADRSSLPPLQASPVSADTRLTYVLRHFHLAYATEDALPTIGYAATQPNIEVADAAGAFFEQVNPYPPEPSWRDWQGRTLPFFFDPHPAGPLLTLLPGRAEIHADIISAAFYLLSGWQEYYSDERDQHGRFPYSASVQQRYGFVAVPVVNYYFDVLRAAVEHVTGRQMRPRHWKADAPFAAFVSHDIDNLRSAWKETAKQALRRRDWLGFGRQLWQHLTRPDAWDNLAQVQRAVAEYEAVSTFFFIPQHRPAANGTPNADYFLTDYTPEINQLLAAGAEIQLHASIGTSADSKRLGEETQAIPRGADSPAGIRFHYLYWEPRRTPALLDGWVFDYDSTLGFAEHFGFRNSYCLPFHPFDFEQGGCHNFLEIPLNLMDATLHHPRYLQLAPEEIMPAIEPMLGEIERFGGVFSLLWHNENFDPANHRNGPREFHRIMAYLRSRRAAFLTGAELVARTKAAATDHSQPTTDN